MEKNLAEVIKVHARLEPNITVETEVTIQGTGPRGAKKADILVRQGAASIMIDVGILEPGGALLSGRKLTSAENGCSRHHGGT